MNVFRHNRFLLFLSVTILLFMSGLFAAAEEPIFLKDSLPGGFASKEAVKIYTPDNLYEYINGQAVFYLSYRFVKVEHGNYIKNGDNYYVDVYELGSRLSALGAYRQQKESDAAVLDAGCEGAISDYLAVFHKGNYYIEIIAMSSGNNDVENMRQIAKEVDAIVTGESQMPPELSLFPAEGLITGSERYVDENLISYTFMGRGLNANYINDGNDKEARLFISIADNTDKVTEIFSTYKDKLGDAAEVNIGLLTGIKGQEPYRGTTIICSWNNYVFGCLNAENEQYALKLLGGLLNNLQDF